ncbi:MAG: 3-keto-5-aminohexanoate cleavage protein [Candidatus Geothermarchaeales archaeon]
MLGPTPTPRDPWGLIYLFQMSQLITKRTVVGASIGRRNCSPPAVFSVILEVDCILVGMEDRMWVYPHKPEILQSTSQVVRKIVNIGRKLGREIATPDEGRQIVAVEPLT